MNNLTKAALATIGGLALAGCDGLIGMHGEQVTGSGNVVTQDRTAKGFHAIEASGAGDFHISVGSAESVKVTADDNLQSLITVEVKDGTLVINQKKNLKGTKKIAFDITLPNLDGLQLNGAGNIDIQGAKGPDLKIGLSGAGDVTATGSVNNLSIELSGAGSAKLYDLQTKETNASIEGAGDIQVSASDKLNATISGAGSVLYHGNPTVTKSISGAGSVKAG